MAPVERPPYSYMALIQFAINSHGSRRMTLKEIYTWIEDRFPYFRQVAKPGWKVPLETRSPPNGTKLENDDVVLISRRRIPFVTTSRCTTCLSARRL